MIFYRMKLIDVLIDMVASIRRHKNCDRQIAQVRCIYRISLRRISSVARPKSGIDTAISRRGQVATPVRGVRLPSSRAWRRDSTGSCSNYLPGTHRRYAVFGIIRPRTQIRLRWRKIEVNRMYWLQIKD